MKNVELRWVAKRISPTHKSMTLQYRIYHPNYAWSEWITVPTYDEELEKAAELMSDKGYQTGDLKNIPERNYNYDQ